MTRCEMFLFGDKLVRKRSKKLKVFINYISHDSLGQELSLTANQQSVFQHMAV